MRQLSFTKMQGLGNDFVVIDDWSGQPATRTLPHEAITPDIARHICDRRFGIGADQILWLKRPHQPTADVRMEVLNADGTSAEMCGNGIRAIALYIDRRSKERKTEYTIETLAGIKTVRVKEDTVAVDMGKPTLMAGLNDPKSSEGELISIHSSLTSGRSDFEPKELRFYEVSMGNPHAVFFVENISRFPVEEVGPLIESHPRFPDRTNVEFVEILAPDTIQVRVWERGAGPTLACGTGACAAAVASLALRKVRNPVNVLLPGGQLRISWDGDQNPVIMEGPAKEVFQGMLFLP